MQSRPRTRIALPAVAAVVSALFRIISAELGRVVGREVSENIGLELHPSEAGQNNNNFSEPSWERREKSGFVVR